VVPSWDTVEDIWVRPESRLKVEHDGVAELRLRVPSTVNVDSVSLTEDGVTSSWFGWVVVWLDLFPKIGFSVEAVDVVEGNTGVVETSMTSEDVDFLSNGRGTSVGSWGWHFLAGLLSSNAFSPDFFPLKALGVQVPSTIKSFLWILMASEDEKFFVIVGRNGNVLCSS